MRKHHSNSGVFLTYAADRNGDGFGAQAQRLLGIFSASRKLGFGYIHSPIRSIESNPGDPHTTERERLAYLREINALFELPTIRSVNTSKRWHLGHLTKRNIFILRQIHGISRCLRIPIVVELTNSLPWSDANPDSYKLAAIKVSPRFEIHAEHETFRVDVHIRRAVAPVFGKTGEPYDRYVPTEWYREVIDVLVDYFQGIDLPYLIRLHTDLPKSRWKVPNDISPGTRGMWEHHNLLDNEGFLIDQGEDLKKSFSCYESIEFAQEWDPIKAMTSMVSADVLITCASSFSYVAGLLRGNHLTVSPLFFHTNPSCWHTVSTHMTDQERSRLIQGLASEIP